MAADSGNDDYTLHNLSIDRGFELVCPGPEYTTILQVTDYN